MLRILHDSIKVSHAAHCALQLSHRGACGYVRLRKVVVTQGSRAREKLGQNEQHVDVLQNVRAFTLFSRNGLLGLGVEKTTW